MFYVAVDDVRAEMRHLNVGPDLLSEIFKRFRDNRVKYFLIPVNQGPYSSMTYSHSFIKDYCTLRYMYIEIF